LLCLGRERAAVSATTVLPARAAVVDELPRQVAYVQKAHIDAVLLSAIRRAATQQRPAPSVEREVRALEAAPAFP